MLGSGVAILDALDIVAKTSGNKIVENAIYSVCGPVLPRGAPWRIPLAPAAFSQPWYVR